MYYQILETGNLVHLETSNHEIQLYVAIGFKNLLTAISSKVYVKQILLDLYTTPIRFKGLISIYDIKVI